MPINHNRPSPEKAVLVGLVRDSRQRARASELLDELALLTDSAGAVVIGRHLQTRPSPDPAFYIGRGLVKQIREQLLTLGGNLVIFDDPLSPAQQRNLEEELEVKVIDRSVLILDIFAIRARTAAARLQVELAQLEYRLPRLTGAWVHFSRQYGGIGAKGPGETQLEVDRRQCREKISHLKERLARLDRQRETQRQGRRDLFKVALVGYTNAGKSTLFNALTKAEVPTADRLFTTLDSVTRGMSAEYPCKVVFADTVGFIRKLPHQLVESFKSTLEEVHQADLILQVVNATVSNLEEEISQTRQVLTEIGADRIPHLMVFNKIDLASDFVAPLLDGARSFRISALQKLGLADLKAEIVAEAGRFLATRQGGKEAGRTADI